MAATRLLICVTRWTGWSAITWLGGGSQAPRASAATRGFPAVNVWEEGERLLAEAELPGVKSEELDVSVVGHELTVRRRVPKPSPRGRRFTAASTARGSSRCGCPTRWTRRL